MEAIYCNPDIAEELNKTYRLDDAVVMSISDLRSMFNILENEKDAGIVYRAVLNFADDHKIPYDKSKRGKATFLMKDIYRMILKRSHIRFCLDDALAVKLIRTTVDIPAISADDATETPNLPKPKRKYTKRKASDEKLSAKKTYRKKTATKTDVLPEADDARVVYEETVSPDLTGYEWYRDAEALATLFRTTAEKVMETAVQRLKDEILGTKGREVNPFV